MLINNLKIQENRKFERIINKMKIKSKSMKKFISLVLLVISISSISTVIHGMPKSVDSNNKAIYASEFQIKDNDTIIDGFHLLDDNKIENENIINSLNKNKQ